MDATPADQNAVTGTVLVGHPSRMRILEMLQTCPTGCTVAEIARGVGLQHNAVRKQLRILEAASLVRAAGTAPGGVGRPAARYRRIATTVDRSGGLARLLALLVAESGVTEQHAEDLGRREGRALVGAGAGADAVIEVLDELGFSPRQTPSEPRLLDIELRRCAFSEAALGPGGQLVCCLHRGLTAGIAEQALDGGRLTRFDIADPRIAHCRAVVGYG